MQATTVPVRFVIHGEPASKANQRKLVMRGKKPAFIKSAKGLAYEAIALRQIPPMCRLRLEGPVRATLRIYYASERPDLDESLLLDVLQDRYTTVEVPDPSDPSGKRKVRQLVQAGVYRNDRQVRERHVYHGVDKQMPRAEIEIAPIGARELATRWHFSPLYGWMAEQPAGPFASQGALL